MKIHSGLALSLLLSLSPSLSIAASDVVISQVYGGGGNSGSTWRNDFIELYNRGSVAVDITGWSVQYASASGTTWQVTALSGTIQPGSYYLVQEALGVGGSVSLPTPDAAGSIPLSASSGKVALVTQTIALSGPPMSPGDLAMISDLAGYGTATFYEGSAAAPMATNTTAVLRKSNGSVDTDDNAADFEATTPNPRNSTVVSVSDPREAGAPETYLLRQNYPNPFNPSTMIRFELPRGSHVSITVFNTLGQEVATLLRGEQETGTHEVRFDATGLPSGVYLYRMQAGGFVQSRKFVVVK